MILLKNHSKCCKAQIQVETRHFGGFGADYTEDTFFCLKCKKRLLQEEMIYENDNKKKERRNKKLKELQEICKTDAELSKTGRLQMVALLEGMMN